MPLRRVEPVCQVEPEGFWLAVWAIEILQSKTDVEQGTKQTTQIW